MEAALQEERELHARRMAQENQQQQQRKKQLLMSGGAGGGGGLRRKGGAGGGSMAAVFATVDEDEGGEDGKEQQQQQQQQRKRSRWDIQKGEGQKKEEDEDEEGGEEGPLSEALQATIRQAAEWVITNPHREKEMLKGKKGKEGWEFLFEEEERGEEGVRSGRRKRAWRERMFYLEVLEEGRVKEQVKRVALGLDEVGGGAGGRGGGGGDGGPMAAAAAAAAASVAALSRMNLPASTVSRLSSSPTAAAADTTTTAFPTSTQQRKPKRNRWGPSPGETSTPSLPSSLPPSLLAVADDDDAAKEKGKKGRGGKQSLDVFLPSVMDAAAVAQLKEQKKIQLIEKKIREAARLKALGKEGGGGGGGEVELFEERMLHYEDMAEKGVSAAAEAAEEEEGEGGGTWEHKKRAKEMLKTAQDALSLTLASKGKHHLSQYLPTPGDLNGFLSKKGESEEKGWGEDYEGNKLDVGNSAGMQMLKKQGWKEGQGLGKEGRKGVVAPVNLKGTGGEGLGVGGEEEEEEEKGDDFDEYRKRMMLAYRFRPNPLNNPRREYY